MGACERACVRVRVRVRVRVFPCACACVRVCECACCGWHWVHGCVGACVLYRRASSSTSICRDGRKINHESANIIIVVTDAGAALVGLGGFDVCNY